MATTDLVLSSGFLAFARHIGFLRAVEAAELEVDAICGTSSGALVAALWAAGHPLDTISAELSSRTPLSFFRLHKRPWQGLVSLRLMVELLEDLLPPTFADLQRPLGVGVVDGERRYRLLTGGELASAVAASCAIPHIFAPVWVDGEPFIDGGVVDRLGLAAFRAWRPENPVVAHHVERTAGRDVAIDPCRVTLVTTPRSGARFWDLGDFAGQVAEAERITAAALADAGRG